MKKKLIKKNINQMKCQISQNITLLNVASNLHCFLIIIFFYGIFSRLYYITFIFHKEYRTDDAKCAEVIKSKNYVAIIYFFLFSIFAVEILVFPIYNTSKYLIIAWGKMTEESGVCCFVSCINRMVKSFFVIR